MFRVLSFLSLALFLLTFVLLNIRQAEAELSKHLPIPNGVIDALNNDAFEALTVPPKYNKYLPPQKHHPIAVNISVLLFGFGSLDEAKTEFSLHILLRISWFDERIQSWNATDSQGQPMVLEGGSFHLDRLWVPSLHVPNSKVPNILQDRTQNPVLTRIQSDGQILVSKRIVLQGVSQMGFRLYPLDVQAIDFEIESNELSYENLQLYWGEVKPVDINDNFVWNGYNMDYHTTKAYRANYTHTGTFSRITATFYLSRVFGQFLLDVYVPIFLYVIISWGSFWIEITAAPARVTLGVTILLTLTTASRTAREKLPPVSYIHALDIWITVCIFFVFGVIIEYTAVNYIFFREKRALLKKNKRKKSMQRRELYEKKILHSHSNGNLKALGAHPHLSFNDKFLDPTATITSDDVSLTITSASSENFCIQNRENNINGASNSNLVESSDKPISVTGRIGTYFGKLGKVLREKNEDRKYGRHRRIEGCEEVAYEIDRISRIAFPTMFFCFNLAYWVVINVASRWNRPY